MSHAAVGQRSAHRPQCTQTSSSFTIRRPVCGSALGREERLVEVERRRREVRAQVGFVAPSGVMVRQFTGQTSTQASHSMQSVRR